MHKAKLVTSTRLKKFRHKEESIRSSLELNMEHSVDKIV
jgi:hypothetical protein